MKKVLITAICLGLGVCNTAQADFSGAFVPANWTSTLVRNGSVNPTSTSVVITGNDEPIGINIPGTTSYTIVAPASGTGNFSWSFNTADTFGPSFDPFVFLNNGVKTTISDDNGANSQSGASSILVNAGQQFGFGIFSVDGALGAANVTISNFLFKFFGPNALDTRASMQRNASALRGFFSLQASYVNPGLSYDCSIFDDKGICFSLAARNTSVSASGVDATSGVATIAYRVNPNIRIGAFIEQLASGVRDGGVRLDNDAPDFGIFGVWQANEDGEGLKARAAYRYGKQDVSITRQAILSAQQGTGETDLTTQGIQLTVSNGFRVHDQVIVSPYAGLRYINIERDGYSEDLTAVVTAPLTYDDLKQEATQALLGVNFAAQLTSAVNITGSVVLEHDVSRKIDNYSASGVSSLESIRFNDDAKRTRAVASAGVGYRFNQTQQLGAQVVYREEAYGDRSTMTGMIT